MPFQDQLWQELPFSYPFFYFNDLSPILSSGGFGCCSLQPIFSFCQDRVLFLVYPFNRSVVSFCSSSFILSSFSFSFQLKCYQNRFFLFLFLNGVLSASFISVVFFSRNVLTFAWFFGFTHLSKKQLSFTSPLSLPFSLRCHSRSRDEILS